MNYFHIFTKKNYFVIDTKSEFNIKEKKHKNTPEESKNKILTIKNFLFGKEDKPDFRQPKSLIIILI